MATPWNRPDLTKEAIDQAADQLSQVLSGLAAATVHVAPTPRKTTTSSAIVLRVLDSLVHEFEQAGVDMIPVSHLRTVIDRIKAEEKATHGSSSK